jgi:ABC-2 type transport system permease protein
MTRLVRVELLKLRTMRVTYGLLAAAVAVTALFASLEASPAGRAVPPIATATGLGDVTTVSGVAMILAAVLGVIVTSGEFRHTSATLTYLAAPDRRRVLGAKAVATALVGACYGLAAGIVATAVGLAFVAGDGDHVTLGAATLVGHVAGAGAGAALLAAVGVGIGSLIRTQLAGVIGVFV